MKIIKYYKWGKGETCGFWIRFFGYGISISTLPLLFSERNGYTKVFKIGRFKIKTLRRTHD